MTPLLFDAITLSEISISQGPECNEPNRGFESGIDKDEVPREFYRLLEDTKVELHQRWKSFNRLEFIITLLPIKVSNKWSNKSFQQLLETLHKAFNYCAGFPQSSYEAKK